MGLLAEVLKYADEHSRVVAVSLVALIPTFLHGAPGLNAWWELCLRLERGCNVRVWGLTSWGRGPCSGEQARWACNGDNAHATATRTRVRRQPWR